MEESGGKTVLIGSTVVGVIALVLVPIVFLGFVALWIPIAAGGAASAVFGSSNTACTAAHSRRSHEDVGPSANLPEEYRSDLNDAAREAGVPAALVVGMLRRITLLLRLLVLPSLFRVRGRRMVAGRIRMIFGLRCGRMGSIWLRCGIRCRLWRMVMSNSFNG